MERRVVEEQQAEFHLFFCQRVLWVLRDGIQIAGTRQHELGQARPERFGRLDVFGGDRASVNAA